MNLFFKFTKPNEEEEEGALPQAFPSGQRPRALSIALVVVVEAID